MFKNFSTGKGAVAEGNAKQTEQQGFSQNRTEQTSINHRQISSPFSAESDYNKRTSSSRQNQLAGFPGNWTIKKGETISRLASQ
jgi:hypothetical protein